MMSSIEEDGCRKYCCCFFFFFFFNPVGSDPKESVFWTEFTCTRPMTATQPTLPSPPALAAAHAAGWRSRRRQPIRRTQERGENGRRERSVHSLTAEHNVLSCPPSSLPLSPLHGCGALRADVGRPHKPNLARVSFLSVKKSGEGALV